MAELIRTTNVVAQQTLRRNNNNPKSVIRIHARLVLVMFHDVTWSRHGKRAFYTLVFRNVSGWLTRTSLEVRTKSQELWHTILVLISYLLLCFLPLRAEVTLYSVKYYANFRQCSDSVVYLFPTYLCVPSGLDVASFFIISFFDMFPIVFPLWNGKERENDRITIE